MVDTVALRLVFACVSRHQRRRWHFGARRPTPTRCAGRRSSRSARTATTRGKPNALTPADLRVALWKPSAQRWWTQSRCDLCLPAPAGTSGVAGILAHADRRPHAALGAGVLAARELPPLKHSLIHCHGFYTATCRSAKAAVGGMPADVWSPFPFPWAQNLLKGSCVS